MQARSWRTATTPAHAGFKNPARASDTARAHTDTDLSRVLQCRTFSHPNATLLHTERTKTSLLERSGS
eukprot:861525-Amphidinium_carterae.1